MDALLPMQRTIDRIVTLLLLKITAKEGLTDQQLKSILLIFSSDDLSILAEDKTASLKCSHPLCFNSIQPFKHKKYEIKIGQGLIPADNFGYCSKQCKELFGRLRSTAMQEGNTHQNKDLSLFSFIEGIDDLKLRNEYNKLSYLHKELNTPFVKVQIKEHKP